MLLLSIKDEKIIEVLPEDGGAGGFGAVDDGGAVRVGWGGYQLVPTKSHSWSPMSLWACVVVSMLMGVASSAP